MRSTQLALLLSVVAANAAIAQIVIPNGLANTEGASSTAYPWGRGVSQIRVQYVFDSSHFLNQSINFPIAITGLRWRANGGATGNAGTYNNVTIQMATCPLDQAVASTTFANNLGPNVTTVHSGPVSVAAGAGTTPNNWYVSIPALSTPFIYDPTAGDLTFDFATDAAGWVGASGGAVDCGTTGSLTSRIYNLTNFAAATGTFQANVGITTEITFAPVSGTLATATRYGQGCYDRASSTFYELFPASTFDLSNSSLALTPTGTGYSVTTGSNQWFTPQAAPLTLTDDSVSGAQPLGFTLAYPGGTTNDVYISSNGFVWAQAGGVNGCCNGDGALLVAQGARWCPLWNDLNPGAGGAVQFDQDPSNGAAYVTFTNVVEFGTTNANTFQVAFFNTGVVEYRWQGCAVTSHVTLTGWSPGGNARNPGSIDITASLPLLTQPDLTALALNAAPRPVLGNTVVLTSTNVPAGSTLGATILSFTQHNPGIDLTGLGMPGCLQFVGLDATSVFLPVGGSGSTSFFLPNNPLFLAAHLYAQSAAFSPGANALGVVSSNGVDLFTGNL